MSIEAQEFYELLARMEETSRSSVDAHRPTFEREFGQSMDQARAKHPVTESTDKALVRSSGVLEVVRMTEGVSDQVRFTVAHMLNVFLLRDEWVQGTKIDVFLSGLTQKFGDEVRLIHKELTRKEHEELLRPSFPDDRN